jgi:hypothetical protein
MNEAEKVKSIYPDVVENGGLLAVVRRMFKDGPTGVEVNGFGSGQNYAHIKFGQRSSQVFLRLDERRFLFDFWEEQKKRAFASSPDLREVRAAIEKWLQEETSVDSLIVNFPFVQRKAPKK